jgi:hypothetical protein
MKSLPQGFEFLSSLRSLSIERCEELVLDADISKAELEPGGSKKPYFSYINGYS